MFRVSLCLLFIAIILNGSRTTAETEITTTQDATEESRIEPSTTIETKIDNSSPSTEKDDLRTDQPKVENERDNKADQLKADNVKDSSRTDANPDDVTQPTDKAATEAPKDNSKVTRSIDEDKSSKIEDPKKVYEEAKNIDNIIETILAQSFGRLKDPLNVARQDQQEDSSYFDNLRGGLVIPALRAHQVIHRGLEKTNEGLKVAGSGTSEAAEGAFTFLREAANNLMRG
ncbi:uncharacterized protein LOC142980540 [Anticarsia gemmatalis]|uniref:uncharacterized protein LOC142980540 n=1 Tax=Anticarsia gemmatalis TaxID=129554 RepID=UPI003F7708D5